MAVTEFFCVCCGRMPHFVSAVLWLVLSPLVVACDVITVLVLIHYYPFYHGTDILLFSAMIAMSINTLLIPPIPAILEIASIKWNSNLCQFYVWSFITFRVLQILTVLCMTVMWSSILKAATKGKRINFTGIIKGVVPTIWIVSGVMGLLPIIGAVPDTYHSGNTCFFMSSGLGPGFSIFIGILIIACMIVSLICSCDVMMLLNYVRKVALVKYGAGRFYLPKKKSEVPGSGTYTTHERYHQLTFAWDLSRLTLVWTLVSFMVNHLPYTVVEFISLVANPSRSDMEEVVVWLVLVEGMCLPNILWCVSRRYRHALVYSWKVHVLKHPAEEEEDSPSCTLRSYYKHHHNGVPRGPGSAGVQIASVTNSLADGNSLDRRVHPDTPERVFPSTSMTQEARRQLQQQQANSHRNGRLDRYPSIENSNRQPQHEKVIIESRPSSVAKSRDSPLTVLPSGSPTQKYHFPDEPEALARTASSRREWKEQMRKKHLPPIFVNEAFDADEANRLRRHRNHNCSVEVEGSVGGVHHVREESASQQSLHFYMSGDYHHDNLNTDSLPRKKHILQHRRSESEGLTGQYDEADIENILDTGSVRSAETMYRTGIKHMSSFHAPAEEENKYRQKYSNDVIDSDDNDDATISQQNLPDVITDGVTSFVDYRNPLETVPNEEPRNADDAKGELRCSGSPVVTMNTIEEVEYSLSYIDPKQTEEEEEESLDVFKTDLEPYGEFHVKLPRTSVTSEQRNSSVSVSSFEDEIRFPPLHKKDSSTPNDNRWERFTNTHGSNLGPYHRSRNFESPNSNMSTPVSFTFDEDTDRGFEEALSVGYPDTSSIYSGTPGAPSGSLSEDPDVSVSNPFQECDASFEEDNFRTHAVVSTKSVDSRSTTSSENPFDSLPPLRTESKGVHATNTLSREKGEYSPTSDITVNSTTEADYGDSGFNSGLDSALPVSRDVSSSPWPLSEETRKSVDMCFESNFSSNDSLNQNESVNVSRDIHSEYSQKEYIPTSKPLTAKDVDPVYF